MEKHPLGPDGPHVTCIGYGTNMLGRQADPRRPNDDEATTEDYFVSMVHAALEAGIDLLDTANSYQDTRSESLRGLALEGRRDEAVIATKCGSRSRDFSADGIRRECAESLERLRTDRVDLLQLHNPSMDDLQTADWAEGLRALRDEGTIGLGGVSVGSPEHGVWLLERGLADALQVNFNVFRPEARERMLPMAAESGVAVLVKIPMARGLLTGKYGSATEFPDGDWHAQGFVDDRADMLARIDRLNALAADHAMTTAKLALRWVAGHAGVTAAIPGAKRVEHLRENAAAGEAGPLPADLLDAVEAIAGR